ncbi:hypothetical protein LOAG_14706, partial [Loa loa]
MIVLIGSVADTGGGGGDDGGDTGDAGGGVGGDGVAQKSVTLAPSAFFLLPSMLF